MDTAMIVHASGARHAEAVEASRESCSLLTINGGSSRIRFALYEESEPLRLLLDGKVDRVGLSGTNLSFKDSTGQPQDRRTEELMIAKSVIRTGSSALPTERS